MNRFEFNEHLTDWLIQISALKFNSHSLWGWSVQSYVILTRLFFRFGKMNNAQKYSFAMPQRLLIKNASVLRKAHKTKQKNKVQAQKPTKQNNEKEIDLQKTKEINGRK